MYSRTLIAEFFVLDTEFSHIAELCFDTVFSHVDRQDLLGYCILNMYQPLNLGEGGVSMKSMGSLRGGAPHEYADEGGSGGERAAALSHGRPTWLPTKAGQAIKYMGSPPCTGFPPCI